MPELDSLDYIEISRNGHVSGDITIPPDSGRRIIADFGPVEKFQGGRFSASRRKGVYGGGGGLYDELGRTGLRHWGGFLFEEWLRELQQGRRAAEIFREMADSDPVIGSILYVIEMLVRRVDWWMEPASSKEVDKVNADLMWSVLTDTYHSFEDMVAEILSFLPHGWAYFENVFKIRGGDSRDPKYKSKYSDGKIGLRKLGIRSQDSLWKWVFSDDGELVGLIQNPPPDYQIRFIPYEKALLFRTKTIKDNPEGKSILRTSYRPWIFIKNLQNIEGIGAERDLAGLPMLTAPEGVDIWNQNDPAMVNVRAAAQNVVSSIRRDEQEGILLPFGWELKPFPTSGRRQFDVGSIITRYEQRIATSVLADVVLLGMDKVGSYALASEKVALLGYSIGSYLDSIANVINTRLTPQIFALNGMKGFTDYPTLCHGAVETLDLETLGTFLTGMANAANAGLLAGEDGLATQGALYQRAGLPIPANPLVGVGPDTVAQADASPTASPAKTPTQAARGADRKMPKSEDKLSKPVMG